MGRFLEQEDGGAMVEAAISLLVILPIFFYAMFIDDLLRYYLGQQETVTATVWDYAVVDYQSEHIKQSSLNGGGSKPGYQMGINYAAQMTWCDHTTAYDSYEKSYDCDSEEHHGKGWGAGSAVAAHQCWLHSDAQQVDCVLRKKNTGTDFYEPTARAFAGAWNRGGVMTCGARLAVLNYFVPNKLFQEFSQEDVDLMNKKRFADSSNVHSDARGAASADVFLFPKEDFGLLVDTWALYASPEIRRSDDGRGPLFDRVETVYTKNPMYRVAQGAWWAFTAVSFINVLNTLAGDDPTKTRITYRPGSDTQSPPQVSVTEERGTGRFYATPWRDWRSDNYKRTWDRRGQYYMGNQQAQQAYR